MHISHKVAEVPKVVVIGCGNLLLGDDGFGPAVIAALAAVPLPAAVQLVDAGTGIREQLLDYLLLADLRPRLLIVVDAAPRDNLPIGTLRLCSPEELPGRKVHDVSLHQFPTVNLLAELSRETGVQVQLLLAATDPEPARFQIGLSPQLQGAVAEACARIRRLIGSYTTMEACLP